MSQPRKKILVVEDERPLARAMQLYFRGLYDVYVATDGMQALELLEEQQFDLMLLDLHMPRMSGESLLDELQKRSRQQDTIVLSNNTECKHPHVNIVGCFNKSDTPLNELKRAIKGVFAKTQTV